MTRMIIAYVLFILGGLLMLRGYRLTKKDKAIFIGITTLGAALWGSIILKHPFDVNKAIAWMLTQGGLG
ncbi:hypothetical protein [Cohnella lupini]|uniref:Uncharacterized protein n=1 Tax=Cohnella lupini TaxID=1294267 RepID=A0A3D9IBP5_9BACL|nr:hypothetical protein [Cohnella lupini]RED59204.1 hypothetical protein DFP95_10742 [Cohnella lupini]